VGWLISKAVRWPIPHLANEVWGNQIEWIQQIPSKNDRKKDNCQSGSFAFFEKSPRFSI
jgi:hypothetical protein